eukprot:2270315-Amphidinium_carterae.1
MRLALNKTIGTPPTLELSSGPPFSIPTSSPESSTNEVMCLHARFASRTLHTSDFSLPHFGRHQCQEPFKRTAKEIPE